MKNIEQELKLFLDEREYNILLEQSKVKPTLQINYYFGYRGMSKEKMVRIREKLGVYVLCYKERLSQIEGVTVCDEREMELEFDAACRFIDNGIRQDELKNLLSVDVGDDLVCLGNMETYRAKFQLAEWTLELDKNVYFDKTDYEVECEHRDVVALSKLKNYLYYAFGIVINPATPKVERFMKALNCR
ncbi:MAG: CYTH domain-containing protein [Clostridiales bacterium]|nr:CYTH domain-containing protein [Clostridiales bacterium]